MLVGAIVGLITAIIIVIIRTQQAKKAPKMDGSDNPFGDLRNSVLATTPESLGLTPGTDYQDFYGAVMEYRIGKEAVVLVAFANGNAGLHFSGQRDRVVTTVHPKVSPWSRNFMESMAKPVAELQMVQGGLPIPMAKQVNLYLLSDKGLLGKTESVNVISKNASPWKRAFNDANQLAALVRRFGAKQY